MKYAEEQIEYLIQKGLQHLESAKDLLSKGEINFISRECASETASAHAQAAQAAASLAMALTMYASTKGVDDPNGLNFFVYDQQGFDARVDR